MAECPLCGWLAGSAVHRRDRPGPVRHRYRCDLESQLHICADICACGLVSHRSGLGIQQVGGPLMGWLRDIEEAFLYGVASPDPGEIYGTRSMGSHGMIMSSAACSASVACSCVGYPQTFRSAAELQALAEQQQVQLKALAEMQKAQTQFEKPKKPIFHCPYCDRGYWDVPPHTCRGCGAGLA